MDLDGTNLIEAITVVALRLLTLLRGAAPMHPAAVATMTMMVATTSSSSALPERHHQHNLRDSVYKNRHCMIDASISCGVESKQRLRLARKQIKKPLDEYEDHAQYV